MLDGLPGFGSAYHCIASLFLVLADLDVRYVEGAPYQGDLIVIRYTFLGVFPDRPQPFMLLEIPHKRLDGLYGIQPNTAAEYLNPRIGLYG